jgi:DNA-binding FadR family transcriptional regulator
MTHTRPGPAQRQGVSRHRAPFDGFDWRNACNFHPGSAGVDRIAWPRGMVTGRPPLSHTHRVTRDEEAGPPAPYRPGYEVVAEQILLFIAELELRPGDRMPTENELAARMGTSRTVVREAVKILSAIGRVRVHKGRGLYVSDDEGMLGASRWGGFFLPADLDHVYMLFEFRRVQETAAGRLAAANATPVELRAIEAAAETCRRGHLTGQAALFDRGDDDFHLGIAAASHNQFLRRPGRPPSTSTTPWRTTGGRSSAGSSPGERLTPRSFLGEQTAGPVAVA